MEKKKKEDVQKEDTLKPITKVNSKLDKEMQEWEVESTTSGGWVRQKPRIKKTTMLMYNALRNHPLLKEYWTVLIKEG